MKVSVVIPMYNAAAIIGPCLKALAQQQRPPDEVIVVDNNSTDISRKIVEEAMGSYKNLNILLSSEKQIGPSAARNHGVDVASGDIIAFTDSDCIVDENWVREIVSVFGNDSKLDGVGGINRMFLPPVTPMGKFLAAFWLAPGDFKCAVVTSQADLFKGKFISTFNCAFKKKFLQTVGGFDNSFKVGEDFDFFLRALEHNGKLLAGNPNLVICHQQEIGFIEMVKKFFHYGEALPRVVARHFRQKIFIKKISGFYYAEHAHLTVVILGTFIKAIVSLTVLAVVICFFAFWIWVLVAVALVYLFFHVRRLVHESGAQLTIGENLLAVIFFFGRHAAEEAGRIKGSLKYKVFCL